MTPRSSKEIRKRLYVLLPFALVVGGLFASTLIVVGILVVPFTKRLICITLAVVVVGAVYMLITGFFDRKTARFVCAKQVEQDLNNRDNSQPQPETCGYVLCIHRNSRGRSTGCPQDKRK